MAKIQDLTLLSDIFPTGYHAAIQAGVTTVDRISGRRWARGPCLRGVLPSVVAVVIVGDMIPEHLTQARSFGCETVDLRKDASLAEQIAQITGEPLVDSAIDCVGFEARGHGSAASVEQPATVLNSIMEITRAGGSLGIPGLYVTGDPATRILIVVLPRNS